jgi:hypothetical protein
MPGALIRQNILRITAAILVACGTNLFWQTRHEDRVRREAIAGYVNGLDDSATDTLVHWQSFNSLQESREDRDGDGKYDRWTAQTGSATQFETTITFDDVSKLGTPEHLDFHTLNDRAEYRVGSSVQDKNQGVQIMRLPDLKHPESKTTHTYYDINMDGRFDVMDFSENTTVTRFLLVSGDFVTVEAPSNVWNDLPVKYEIRTEAGNLYRFDFDFTSGHWKWTKI